MKNLLILQHYSPNKGNAALLFSLVENIKILNKSINIIVSSYDPKDTKHIFNYNAIEWPFIFRKIADNKGILRYKNLIIEIFKLILLILVCAFVKFHLIPDKVLKSKFLFIYWIKKADLILYPGGHLFTNFNHFPGNLIHFFPSMILRIMNRNYIILGQTIGPFFGFYKIPTMLITKFVLDGAQVISIRDTNSFKSIYKLNIPKRKVIKTSDVVLLFPKDIIKKTNIKKLFDNESKILGITIHHIYFKHWMCKNDYINYVSNFIGYVIGKYNFNVVFLSMEKKRFLNSEWDLINQIIANIDEKNKVKILNIPFNPKYTISSLKSIDYLYATKTHSVVFGLLMDIPTLAIAYQQKSIDFMNEFNLIRFSVKLKDKNLSECKIKFDDLVRNEMKIKNQIEKKLKFITKNAYINIKLINNELFKETYF